MAITQFSHMDRTFDLVTLRQSIDCSGASRIHRHDFDARLVRQCIEPEAAASRHGQRRQLLGDSRACVFAGRMTGQMRELACWGRFLETLTGVLPTEGAGIGLVEANILFAPMDQVRRWLFALKAEKPAELVEDLLQQCPRVEVVVLVQNAGTALVRSRVKEGTASVALPTLPLQPRMLDIAESTCHLLGALPAPPSVHQIASAVEFALEAAASPGGLDSFPLLRQRYSALREQLARTAKADKAA